MVFFEDCILWSFYLKVIFFFEENKRACGSKDRILVQSFFEQKKFNVMEKIISE